MDSLDFGAVSLIGVAVSVIVQLVKSQFKTSKYATILTVLALSLIGGGVYVLLVEYSYWQAVVQMLAAAGAFYAFIIKQLEE